MFARIGATIMKLALISTLIWPLLASSWPVAEATGEGQPEDGALAAALLRGLKLGQGVPVLVVRQTGQRQEGPDGSTGNSSSASSSSTNSSPKRPDIYLSWLDWSGFSGFSSYLEPLQSLNSITQPISDAIFKAIPGSQGIFEQFDQAGDTISGMFNPANLISALGTTSSARGSRGPSSVPANPSAGSKGVLGSILRS